MQNHNQETQTTWNSLAKLYAEKFMGLELYNDTYERFCDLLLGAEATVLELGCGPGNITRQLLKRKPKLQVLATDYAEEMVALAQKNNPAIKTQVLDGRNVSLINGLFDGIMCGFLLPYLSPKEGLKLIADCSSLLNSKGVLYISFVAGNILGSGFITGNTGKRTYFYYHNTQALKEALAENSMEAKEVIQKEYHRSETESEVHTIIIAAKSR
jgi:SAM-dependent methyltransferase